MYNTILVPIDLGRNVEPVLRKAIKFAKETNAKLIITHVQPVVVPSMAADALAQGTTLVELSDESKKLMQSYKDLATKNGVKDVVSIVEDGVNIVSTIVDVIAEQHDVDLIVCGSSNTHGLTSFLLGSVSSGIAKHAKCDVFVVKEQKDND